MERFVTAVLKLMAQNRRKYEWAWTKVRVDRVEKLLTPEVNGTAFLAVFLTDPRLKHVMKEDDAGTLHPAVQLRFKAYQQVLKTYDPVH